MRRTEGKRFFWLPLICPATLPGFPCWRCWCLLTIPSTSISSPLAWAVLLYLRHSGIKLRDSKVFPGLSTEKEKWLAFLKTKKVRRKVNRIALSALEIKEIQTAITVFTLHLGDFKYHIVFKIFSQESKMKHKCLKFTLVLFASLIATCLLLL